MSAAERTAGGRRRALLVATAQYEDPGLRELRSPGADVEALAAVLSEPEIGEFEVEPPLVDCRHADVARRIVEFFAAGRPSDLLLLYIAGHGVFARNQRLFFATKDTSLDVVAATAVSDRFVHDQLTESRARSIVLVLDCCHSGAFAKGLAPRAPTKSTAASRKGHVTLSASSPRARVHR